MQFRCKNLSEVSLGQAFESGRHFNKLDLWEKFIQAYYEKELRLQTTALRSHKMLMLHGKQKEQAQTNFFIGLREQVDRYGLQFLSLNLFLESNPWKIS